jgi:hypothetical protein
VRLRTSTSKSKAKSGGEREARPQANKAERGQRPSSGARNKIRRAQGATPRTRDKAKTKAPKVAMISAAAFSLICNQPETELYFVSIKPTQKGDPITISTASQENVDLFTIPQEYHDFADLFSKKEADKLPSHQRYDHTIPLQPGSTPHFGPIYKLSPVELETLRKYIDENLKKGFIRNSQSPYGPPLYSRRKRTDLCACA